MQPLVQLHRGAALVRINPAHKTARMLVVRLFCGASRQTQEAGNDEITLYTHRCEELGLFRAVAHADTIMEGPESL